MANRYVWEKFSRNVVYSTVTKDTLTIIPVEAGTVITFSESISNGGSPSGSTVSHIVEDDHGYAFLATFDTAYGGTESGVIYYNFCFVNGKAYTFDPSLLNHGSDGFYCWGLHWDVSTDTLRVGINWHRPADTTNPVDFEIANAIWETEVDAVYSKGTTSYGYVANASIDEYPEDSYRGSYWYTYIGFDCIDPTAVSCTAPKEGETATIAVTARTNTYGGTIKYRYEYSVDGGSTWVTIETTTATSSTVTVPDGAEIFQVRVLASDDMGFASTDYVYADSQTVASSAGVCAVDGVIREFDVVACVGGVVKTDVETCHGNNGVTTN